MGCGYYKTSGVVGQNLRIHGGEVFRFNVSCLFFGGQKKVSVGRAGIDPLTVLYINFSLWSRCLLSNVSRLRIECVVLIQLNTLKHVHTQICAPWCVLSNAYRTHHKSPTVSSYGAAVS